ncbi:LysR family transcriptional regulator [Achromobacter sp. Marseille-Q0513]|uniref:LysR substrate-binding domain-containing protein n=1 Tax=Achromobacter sp. Marseille-Q0513 TaxID=2829161 RepID=UPI001BA13E57|nr:LysR substrate-binding domain-containing protein [Achromobacter sp. Marseille-Q0513]MBR8654379.1 LysR family transcriptional regulator [Achromobacter sp. Marseille-Q0513]
MKTTRRPSLNDMRAFEAVARLGSMRAAADALALTHGAVSRRVAKLSDDLGLELFEPAGRGLRLTTEGQALASAMGRALALINDTIDSLRDRDAKRPVVLSCERSVAMRWLIPRLSAFQDSHPEIELHLSVGGGPLDFSRDQVSLALRRLDFPVHPDWRVTPLMRESMGPVMTPALLPGFEAGDYVALASRTRPAAWDDWLGQQPGRAAPRATRYLDHHFLIVEAAAAGLGVALCPRILALDDLRSGRLAAPLGFAPDGSEYGLIEPKAAPPGAAPALAALKDWLTGAAREADA